MSPPELIVESCGPLTTLQDGGRPGWQRIGLSPAGALDTRALATANVLVANPPEAAAIELILYGARLRAIGGAVRVALAGADVAISVDGAPRSHHTSFIVPDGACLVIGHATRGVAVVLAVEGGLAVPSALGAVSLHMRAEVGGLDGRALSAGTRIALHHAALHRRERTCDPVPIETAQPIRVVMGPQADQFGPTAIAEFLESTFRVSADADRMGVRLEGPRIRARNGHNIVSDGVVRGAIQVPGSGQPIVMLAEHQTTGGYPKIATVVTADCRRLAQRRPGDPVRFSAVDVDAARAALIAERDDVASLPERLRLDGPTLAWVAHASLLNLAGPAISAHDPATWTLAVPDAP